MQGLIGHGIPFNYIFHEGEIAITKIMGAVDDKDQDMGLLQFAQ